MSLLCVCVFGMSCHYCEFVCIYLCTVIVIYLIVCLFVNFSAFFTISFIKILLYCI